MNGARGFGFTLIELMVTIAVAAVLVALAVPSYRSLITANRLSAAANDYVAALNQARLEAVRRNTSAQFCGASGNGTDTLGSGCSGAGSVRALDGSGNAALIRTSPALPAKLALASAAAVRYGGQGIGRAVGSSAPLTGLVVDLYSESIADNNRRCIYLTTGSVLSTCTASGTAACPTSEPADCE